MSAALARAGAALLGAELLGFQPLAGGNLAQIVRVRLSDRDDVVVKGGPRARSEGAMLNAIAQTGTPVPAVLAADDSILVIAYLQTEGPLSGTWASLGRDLANLHAATGTAYGWCEDFAFGPIAIVNGWSDDWAQFWAVNRLCNSVSHLPVDLARRVERLAADLPNRLPARPRSALLHGDLWGGNVLVSGDRVAGLIDPACYYGHAEVDLAMLGLFDSPEAPFLQAYGQLDAGSEERVPIYQLWPALVHYRLFGAGYRTMVENCLSRSGA